MKASPPLNVSFCSAILSFFTFLFLFFTPSKLIAKATVDQDASCRSTLGHFYLPEKCWNDTEKKIWSQLLQGKKADLNSLEFWDNAPNKPAHLQPQPKSNENWEEPRLIRAGFLRSILLNKDFKDEVPHKGVRISGALFCEELDLSSSHIERTVWLDNSRFEKNVSFDGVKSGFMLSLEGSGILGNLNMLGAVIPGQLNLSSLYLGGGFNLESIHVKGTLFLNDAVIVGAADVLKNPDNKNIELPFVDRSPSSVCRDRIFTKESRVAKGNEPSLATDNAELKTSPVVRDDCLLEPANGVENFMRGAVVDGDLEMNRARFYYGLDMDRAQVEGIFFMRDLSANQFIFVNGSVKGNAYIEGSRIQSLFMEGTRLGGSVFIDQNFSRHKKMCLSFLKVDGNVFFDHSVLGNLELSYASVQGMLSFGKGREKSLWQNDSRLDLKNASATRLEMDLHPKQGEDKFPGIPGLIHIQGMTLSHWELLGAQENREEDMENLKHWLSLHKPYTPQPYQEAAKVLRKAGFEAEASEILYTGRERERQELSHSFGKKIWLLLMDALIGYGYKIERSLISIGVMIALGWLISLGAGLVRLKGGVWVFWFSLGRLLPIIRLDDEHSKFQLHGIVKYYFYVHHIVGFVLGSFLLAGLSGLTR
ncbi:MAG: hypothetical protein G3M78_04290 [Candidatus Nitrohelix vancouverensis]|uniref:Pentapeptide repeat-containing protein n=1 Tax=Candidatus Nitrohelix vancouverensis TaxID=2705534 RepID=A0A7T0G2S6_9BACT|nr:MAG: hypothetical protein G3M78_04290 [Candidatus Nitrohelix vancouverensis]